MRQTVAVGVIKETTKKEGVTGKTTKAAEKAAKKKWSNLRCLFIIGFKIYLFFLSIKQLFYYVILCLFLHNFFPTDILMPSLQKMI